jgi:hypothetical protein
MTTPHPLTSYQDKILNMAVQALNEANITFMMIAGTSDNPTVVMSNADVDQETLVKIFDRVFEELGCIHTLQ